MVIKLILAGADPNLKEIFFEKSALLLGLIITCYIILNQNFE